MLGTMAGAFAPSALAAERKYPDDDTDIQAPDTDDAFVGQDDMFKTKNPFNLMYLGAYVGAAAVTVKSYGNLGASFETGFRFRPDLSAGIFAGLLPDQEAKPLLDRQHASLFGIEGDYHFDRWIKNFYMGLTLGFLNVTNNASFGVGTRAGYDYQVTNFFWLSGQINMFLNTHAGSTGNVFQAMFGIKFQRGKK